MGEEEEKHLEMELLFPWVLTKIILERSMCFTWSFMTHFSFGSYLRGGSFSADELTNLLRPENNEIGYICVMSKALEMPKLNVTCAPPLSSALPYGYYWVASIVS